MKQLYICDNCQRKTDRLEKPCLRCGGEDMRPKFLKHELGYACNCKGCQEARAALQKQIDHQFYKDAEDFREEIKMETLQKAAKKYKEPFNPGSWTIEQLAKHAMAENYDQQNYIYGMYERLQELEKDNNELNKQLKIAISEAEYWRLRLKKEIGRDDPNIIKS